MYARPPLPALFTLVLLAACGTTTDPVANAAELSSVKPGGGGAGSGPSYGVVELSLGTGYTGSANGVNDEGIVVGAAERNDPSYSSRAFVKAGSLATTIFLPEAAEVTPTSPNAWASGVSNANADGLTFVIGKTLNASLESQGARWTRHAAGDVDPPQLLPFTPTGVNEAGTVTGQVGQLMKVLRLNGEELTITPPFTTPASAEFGLNDLNASEDLLYVEDIPAGRSRVRVGDAWVRLDPPTGMEDYQTWGTAVSDRTTLDGNRVVFVSGKLQLGTSECYPTRWTVNVTTGAVVNVERRTENGIATAVNSSGDVTGKYGTGWNSKAFVWARTGSFVVLPTPKGITNGQGYAFSPNGRYIAGRGEKSLQPRALLWTRK